MATFIVYARTDETLDRTSTGRGPIQDYTTEELKTDRPTQAASGIKTRPPIPTLKGSIK